MPTALLLCDSVLPGDGSVPVSSEIHEATIAELLSGSWSGTRTREGQTDAGAAVHKGIFTLPMTPPAKMRLTITAEGPGWFRGTLGTTDLPIVGIWKYERGQLALCSNEAEKGFPKTFEDGKQRDVVTLWMK
jgi:hypothetical protein